jgi:hypothetical protein
MTMMMMMVMIVVIKWRGNNGALLGKLGLWQQVYNFVGKKRDWMKHEKNKQFGFPAHHVGEVLVHYMKAYRGCTRITPLIRNVRWEDHRAGMDVFGDEEKLLPKPGFEPQTFQAVA